MNSREAPEAAPSPSPMARHKEPFSAYQRFVVGLLAFLQFTVVLDFMILAPLGAILIEDLHVTPAQFSRVVSAYAFSAGMSGLLAAGFADRFDRKRLLLFFYFGFVVGTFLCSVAPTYRTLLAARIVTGLFGGVVGSVSFAIITDLFPVSMRGRVMGAIQSSFAASQILGLPTGLYIANHWGWHSTFLFIVAVSVVGGVVMLLRLAPIRGHLAARGAQTNPLAHLVRTATRPRYVVGFSSTILLATGGFMLMPFGSTFLVQNVGIEIHQLPFIYMATGVVTIFAGPLIGRASDTYGKYRTFVCGSLFGCVVIAVFTNLGRTALVPLIVVNILLFVAITARMVSASALTSALPGATDRGAYMAISSSLQQLSGGIAASAAGLIVHQASPTSRLEGYGTLGIVVMVAMLTTIVVMFRVHQLVGGGGAENPRAAGAAGN